MPKRGKDHIKIPKIMIILEGTKKKEVCSPVMHYSISFVSLDPDLE